MVALPRKRVGTAHKHFTQQQGVQFQWLFTLAKYQVGVGYVERFRMKRVSNTWFEGETWDSAGGE